MAWENLPQWKNENSATYAKQQLSLKINKLRQRMHREPENTDLKVELENLIEQRKSLN